MDHKIKPIMACADSGINRNQLMISKWKNGTEKEAIERALYIANDMKSYGLIVQRIKVEAMAHNQGVPQHPNNDVSPSKYFEFHIKYHINSKADYDEIKSVCHQFDRSIGLSFSAFKETIKVLVTIRVSGHLGYINAEKVKDDLINKLKEHHIHSNDDIQKEFSVYDDNIKYDAGWLGTIGCFSPKIEN